MFRFWIVLATLGIVIIGTSLITLHSYKESILGIVFGGVLIQAGITAFALNAGREKRSSRRRRYQMTPAA